MFLPFEINKMQVREVNYSVNAITDFENKVCGLVHRHFRNCLIFNITLEQKNFPRL